LKEIYGKTDEYIEKIETESEKLTKDNKIEYFIAIVDKPQKSKTLWIYDTGVSEHITNNKDILINFKEEKIIMKCANNFLCEFNGV